MWYTGSLKGARPNKSKENSKLARYWISWQVNKRFTRLISNIQHDSIIFIECQIHSHQERNGRLTCATLLIKPLPMPFPVEQFNKNVKILDILSANVFIVLIHIGVILCGYAILKLVWYTFLIAWTKKIKKVFTSVFWHHIQVLHKHSRPHPCAIGVEVKGVPNNGVSYAETGHVIDLRAIAILKLSMFTQRLQDCGAD
jgi:hypothetical protein